MKRLDLKIIRHTYNDSKSLNGAEANNIGDFYINNNWFCYSLEDEIRFEKAYGKTAIPDGEYEIILNVSNRFKRLMPLLLNVPNFSGVRIHGGNTAENSHGCPLIAFNTDKKKIWGSAEKKLTAYLKDWTEKNPDGKIYLTIKNGHLTHQPQWEQL